MGILRPAPVEAKAIDRSKIPDRCNSCHRTGTPLARESRDNIELWLCVNFRDCNQAAKSVNVR